MNTRTTTFNCCGTDWPKEDYWGCDTCGTMGPHYKAPAPVTPRPHRARSTRQTDSLGGLMNW